MKIAVISDIHGNLPALEAVFKSIDSEGVDRIVCLGDLVGYGAFPNECIAAIIERRIPCLLGNHDEAATGKGDLNYFNPQARAAIVWTAQHIQSASISYLSSLPLTLEMEGLLFVHASPREPEAWHYILTQSEAFIAFDRFTNPVCFFGHTHFPMIFKDDQANRRLINVGSVGQPRDRDSRACWGLYHTETGAFKWVRVAYSVETTAQAIIDAGLPRFLADRLFAGY